MISSGYQKNEIIASLGLITGAAFRIIPSTTRIINSISTIKINSPSINLLYDELNKRKQIKSFSSSTNDKINQFKNSIKFKNLFFWISRKKKNLFEDLNLRN